MALAFVSDSIDDLLTALRRGSSPKLLRRITAGFERRPARDRALLLVRACIGKDNWNIRPAVPIVRALLQHGADPDAVTDGRHTYPIGRGVRCLEVLAGEQARRDIEDAAISLVHAGASVGPHGKGLQTALHLAAETGASRLIAALLAAGAKVDARDKLGQTPLFYAARGDRVAAVRALIAAGATDARDRRGETAIDIARASSARRAEALLAKRFPHTPARGSATLSATDVERLLKRHAAVGKTIYAPAGEPDPVIERVLRGGAIKGSRIELSLDPKALPPVGPTMRKQLLSALGEEAKRWLATVGVDTRSYSVGGLRPYYFLAGSKSRARAEHVLPVLRRR